MDKAFAYVVSALIGGFRAWIFVAGLPILQLAHIVDGGRVGPIAIGCVSAFGLS